MPEARGRQRRSQRRWLPWVLAGAGLLAVAYVLQVLLGRPLPTWAFLLVLVGGAATTFLAATLPAVGAARQAQKIASAEMKIAAAQEARYVRLTSYINTLGVYFLPLSDSIDRVINAADKNLCSEAKAALTRSIVDVAYSDLFPKKTRCCYFKLATNSPRRLVCDAFAGRGSKPTYVFTEGKGAGAHVFANIVNHRLSELNPEIKKAQFPQWDESFGFRTYIACTVNSGDKVFGMITVDAENVGDLEEAHHELVRFLAQLLGSMLAVN